MKMALVPVDGGNPILLDKAILFFGRGQECDVVITSSRKVSRKHCCVAQIDSHFVVRDLGSMNGIRVNDATVNQQTVLMKDDFLWIGDVGYQLVPQSKMNSRSRTFRKQHTTHASLSGNFPGDNSQISRGENQPIAVSVADGVFTGQTPSDHVIPDDEILELDDSDILE